MLILGKLFDLFKGWQHSHQAKPYWIILDSIAKDIEAYVVKVLNKGYSTGDIVSNGTKAVGTKEMGVLIKAEI